MKNIIAVILLITLSLLNTTGTADDTDAVPDREMQVEETTIQGTDDELAPEEEARKPEAEKEEPAVPDETGENADSDFEVVEEETEILPEEEANAQEEKTEKPIVHASKKTPVNEENFFDYFEIVETRKVREDVQRQTTSVIVTVSIRLRENYKYTMPYGFENGVTVKYSYVREHYGYTDPAGIDLLNPSATKIPNSEKTFSAESCNSQILFPKDTVLFTSKYTYNSSDDNITISCAKDLVFDSVSGYFYLDFIPGEP